MNEINITLDQTNHEKAMDFFNVYEFELILDTSKLSTKLYYSSTEVRVCRFCKKSKPEVTFKKRAHLIPQFLGNRYLLSSFECDNCNKLFGDLYENDFVNFLGPIRSFPFYTSSKNNKTPIYKETVVVEDKKVTKISIQTSDEKSVQIFYEHPFNDSVILDKEKKEISIHTLRKPYIPLYAYKLLLKIAVSLISDDQIESLKHTIQFLLDNSKNDKLKDFPLCNVYMHSIYSKPMYPNPIAILLKKKESHVNSPTYTFVLCSGNHVYQIFIPFNLNDDWMVGKNVKLFPYPLLFDKSLYEKGVRYSSYSLPMDSNEKKVAEPQVLRFSFQDTTYQEPNL